MADPKETKTEETENLDLKPYYCPGCGRQYDYERQCVGSAEAPHPPIEVVSTDELSGDAENHTPAPNTGP